MNWIKNVPWEVVRVAFMSIRGHMFEVGRPDTQAVAYADVEEVQRALGKHHFTKFWKLSYVYNGEDLNMRRPEYKDDDYEWYQYHVRGFRAEDKTYLNIHSELDPIVYPSEHIDEVNYSEDDGVEEIIMDILREEGIEVELIE